MTLSKKNVTGFMILSILIFSTGGCDLSDEPIESQDEHVCEHLIDGPAWVMEASQSPTQAIDSLMADPGYRVQAQEHTRYDVTLLSDSTGGTYSGYVPYQPVAEDGDYVLYMDESVACVMINYSNKEAVVVPESQFESSVDCDVIASKAIYHLDTDMTYLLHYSAVTEPVVGILLPACSEADDDHEHE